MGTTGQSITLANSIIGVGILAMPFCFQQCGVLLATLILISMGFVSRLCCYFLLKSAIITRRRNFEFLAFHVFGPAGKIAVETGIIGFLMGTCIAYFVVVGDLGPQIIAKLFNINQSDILRTSIMVIVSLVCVLPLGLLRNVDSLSNVSAATIAFYFCLVIKVITEATSQLLTSDWQTKIELWKPSGVLQCVPIFSMALFCQTQLFEIFESLPSQSLEKMCVVTKNAINICASVYFTLGLFGYIAFGSREISGNILMSLSPTMASDVIKLGFVMSLAFSFPLIIFPCRASLYSFLYKKAHSSHHDHIINHSIPAGTFRAITVAIVGVALFVSLLLPNVELVLGLLGATIGVLVCVVFPAACFISVTFKNTNERILAKFVVVLGLIILILGTYANLQAAENTPDKYDDRYITKERIDQIVQDFFQKKEESEDAIAKRNPGLHIEPHKDPSTIDNAAIKDSEAQPPNPVPPESQSNEKHPIDNPVENKDLKSIQEILENKNVLDKVSESHPKNIQIKLNEEKIANGNNVAGSSDSEINSPPKPNEEKIPEKSIQDKIEIQKQQQLIETIKQHGEEQKELIQEQKEILDGLLKTQEELHKNKKEIDNEAKIIAVESIQKIANIAIQRIGGVSDKPADQTKNNKPAEPLVEIADKAVNEIAKKAAETMDALIGDSDKANSGNNDKDKVAIAKTNNDENVKSKIDLPTNQNILPKIIENLKPETINKLPTYNISKQIRSAEISKNPNQVNEGQINEVKIDNDKLVYNNKESKVPIINVNVPNLVDKPKQEESITQNESAPKDTNSSMKKKVPEANILDKTVAQNVPLAVALNGKSNIINQETQNNINEPKLVNNLHNNGASNIKLDSAVVNGKKDKVISARQKREVVDCTQETLLRPEDKQICENLVNKPISSEPQKVYLPDVDIGQVDLSKNIPALAVHMRSLKSFEDKKR